MNADIDITGVVLTTERLILRSWRMDDLNDFFENASVEDIEDGVLTREMWIAAR